MHVIKEPEHGGTSTTEEQKRSSFQKKLQLLANNFKSFAIENKWKIRNNLDLSKCSETNII